jgi:serine/threonine protein kinase
MPHSNKTPFVLGNIINNRYKILSRLNKNFCGPVFKARDLELGSDIFLMVFYPNISTYKNLLTLIKKEFLSSRKISHVNIIKVFSFDKSDGLYFVSMQYVEGISFSDFLSGKSFSSLDDLFRISFQLIDALQTAYSYKVFHTTIHEDNLIIDQNSNVNLFNFGFHNHLGDDCTTQTHIEDLDSNNNNVVSQLSRHNIKEFGKIFENMLKSLKKKKSISSSQLNLFRIILKRIRNCNYFSFDQLYADLKETQSQVLKNKINPMNFIFLLSILILFIGSYIWLTYFQINTTTFCNILIHNFNNFTNDQNLKTWETKSVKLLKSSLTELSGREVFSLSNYKKVNVPLTATNQKLSTEFFSKNHIRYIIEGSLYRAGNLYQIDITVRDILKDMLASSIKKRFSKLNDLDAIILQFSKQIKSSLEEN